MNASFNPAALRAQFPALAQSVHGKPLSYLDNAATTQKPLAVIEALRGYYERDCANVHRGVHELSARANEAYEAARDTVREFIGAPERESVIFLRGTTEAVNLVAASYGGAFVRPGDEILLSGLEHHSNIVPWQLLCQRSGARLQVAAVDEEGRVDLEDYRRKLGGRTRLVALAHVSNALGTVNPLPEMLHLAREAGAATLVDGAQALAHQPVDVAALGCDFYAFSGHKVYGPTGCGALYARRELLEQLPPWQGGGDMIRSVSFGDTQYNDLPWRFEAGTPAIAGAIGLGAALRWFRSIGPEAAMEHEEQLLAAAEALLDELPGLRRISRAPGRVAVLSFVVEGAHPGDIATLLDLEGVAVRSGHHCAEPLMRRFGLPAGCVRASFAAYNTPEDAHRLAVALRKALAMLGVRAR
jgi:cysteine desulfurase / selenocysteine lyase